MTERTFEPPETEAPSFFSTLSGAWTSFVSATQYCATKNKTKSPIFVVYLRTFATGTSNCYWRPNQQRCDASTWPARRPTSTIIDISSSTARAGIRAHLCIIDNSYVMHTYTNMLYVRAYISESVFRCRHYRRRFTLAVFFSLACFFLAISVLQKCQPRKGILEEFQFAPRARLSYTNIFLAMPVTRVSVEILNCREIRSA